MVEASPKTNFPVGADGVVDKDALVKHFGSFVRGIARQVKGTLSSQIEIEDLINYGMTGLLEAADRFDPQFGANFTTFSYYRVRGAIYDGLRGMGWLRRSEYQKTKNSQRANAYLENINNRSGSGTSKSPSDTINQMVDQVNNLVTIFITSLDGMTDLDIEDKQSLRQDDIAEEKQLQKLVMEAIAKLNDEDRQLIQLYYFEEKSLEEVGKTIGLSKSWTCRKHAQAIAKLSKFMQGSLSIHSPQAFPAPSRFEHDISEIPVNLPFKKERNT